MHDLLIARAQMGMSLAFHIVFASIGIALPLMMCIAEALYLRTGELVYLALAKSWSKGAAILFAVGAVSGTVLSFELGLLWPGFMRFSGEIIGPLFTMEGFAFFTEAIFLGVYLYGWKFVSPKAHLFSGVLVALSGALSGFFVVLANGWMNTPVGFSMLNGHAVNINPLAAMLNPAGLPEAIHMLIAAYTATAFLTAGIHSFLLLRQPQNIFHRKALSISLSLGSIMAIVQPLSGDVLAQVVARTQPVKFAALEAHFKTSSHAPLTLGGLPDLQAQDTKFALKIPAGLSLLAGRKTSAVVKGLNDFPSAYWPNVIAVHLSFQIMVACGIAMLAISLWTVFAFLTNRQLLNSSFFLKMVVLVSPTGFIAIEAGWLVTELGRQPWVINNVMLTASSVTPMPGLIIPFVIFTAVYLFLAFVVLLLIYHQITASPLITASSKVHNVT